MASLLPTFNSSPAIHHSVSCNINEDLAVSHLAAMPMGDLWDDAAIPQVLSYCYGAKGLKLPEKWAACFPKTMFS